jgi:hypothetical protein
VSKRIAMGKDRFGNRLGTLHALFNEALTLEPKTQRQLAEESGAAAKAPPGCDYRSGWYHLKRLVEEGMVIQEGERPSSYRVNPNFKFYECRSLESCSD